MTGRTVSAPSKEQRLLVELLNIAVGGDQGDVASTCPLSDGVFPHYHRWSRNRHSVLSGTSTY